MKTRVKVLLILILIALAGSIAAVANKFIKPQTAGLEIPPRYEIHEAPKPPETVQTTLFFAGDIMLSRNVGTKIFTSKNPTIPFLNVAEKIKNSSLSFANLESPFNSTGPRLTDGLVFKAEPNSVEGLTFAGFDIVSTANNHVFDQGKAGVLYTNEWLAENGIKSVGTGLNCHDGQIMTANGIKFGYLAYSYTAYNDGGKSTDPLVCNWNIEEVEEDILRLKPQVDFLIVTAHMGTEYKREPDPANALAAKTTIDLGADLFIGHHPHWFQTIEEYKGKYIFYSLGNFVFDQMWSQETREGLTVQVIFEDKKMTKLVLMPVVIDSYCCPRWATPEETALILKKIGLTDPVIENSDADQ